MKQALIIAAVLGLVLALGGSAEARAPHPRPAFHPALHRGTVRHRGPPQGSAGGGTPHRFGRAGPSPVQRFLAPMFGYAYRHR
jgi:hypothetical protein